MATPRHAQADGERHPHRWLILSVIGLAQLMIVLEVTTYMQDLVFV